MTNNITVKKNNTINKSTISSSNKSSKKDNEIKEKKTSKKESIDIQDFGSIDDEATYLGLVCIMDMTTGYINGPKFCSLASHESKRFDNYSRSDRYKNLLEYMKSSP